MAVSILNTNTKVNLKYGADTGRGLTAYSLGIEVKDNAADDKYYAFAQALEPMVDADGRELESVTLTITETIQ